VSFYVSTATLFFFLLHCDEWDHVVALPEMTKFKIFKEEIFILWELHSKILVGSGGFRGGRAGRVPP
jgi:hypothetical protein